MGDVLRMVEENVVLSQGVRNFLPLKVTDVKNMAAENDVLNQDVLREHKEILISVVRMAVDDDVPIVSIGLIRVVEVCAMIGIVQHVSNVFSQMIPVLK
jgi:hypothetical protein